MTRLLSVSLTESEWHVLERIYARSEDESRSALVRRLLLDHARACGVPQEDLQRVRLDRLGHAPRRSAELCRLIGTRRGRRTAKPSAASTGGSTPPLPG